MVKIIFSIGIIAVVSATIVFLCMTSTPNISTVLFFIFLLLVWILMTVVYIRRYQVEKEKSQGNLFDKLLVACKQDWVDYSLFNENNFPLESVVSDELEWEVVEYYFDQIINGYDANKKLLDMGYCFLNGSRRAMKYISDNPDAQLKNMLIVTAPRPHQTGYWFAPCFYTKSIPSGNIRAVSVTALEINFEPNCGWLVLRRKKVV